jgi:hypothetical protein
MNYRDSSTIGDSKSSRHMGAVAGTIFTRQSFHLLLIAALGVIVYSNTFHVPFIFDDQSSIVNNEVIREGGNFFRNSTGYLYNPRRFIGYLTFALNYRMGGLDVTGYHVFNLAVHVINALLVYALVRLTLQTPFFADRGSGVGDRHPGSSTSDPQLETLNFIALFAGLLFAVHPIQTQAVTYIVQRLTSIMTLFYLLAVILYGRMRVAEESGEGSPGKVLGFYLGSLASVVLAMQTKENAFTLPFAIALYEGMFFRGSFWKRAMRLIPFFATMLIIPLSMLDMHKPMGDVISDVSEVTQHKAPVTRLEYLYTQFRVIVTYLRLLVFPVNQNLDYDYPLYHSLFDPPVFASFLFLMALAGLAVCLTYRSTFGVQCSTLETRNSKLETRNPRSGVLRLIAFGIFWFFLTLAVESSIIPITDVIYEHRVYLPAAGAFIATAALLVTLAGRYQGKIGRKAALAAAVLVVALLGAATFQRNRVWGAGVTLWDDVVKKSPRKVRGYNNLGAALSDAGRKDEAVATLKQAIAIDSEHPEAYYNLGRLLLFYPDRIESAMAMLKRSIELKQNYYDAYVNLAAAYNRAGQPGDAVTLLETIMIKDADNFADRPDAHFNLGVAYSLVGNVRGAAREAMLLGQLDPRLAGQLEQYIMQRK